MAILFGSLAAGTATAESDLAVHNYEDISWDMVFAICTTRLSDFDDFAGAMIRALALSKGNI